MDKKDVFEQLADNLDETERKAMLDEIKDDLRKYNQVDNKESEKLEKKEKEFKLLENEYNNSSLIFKIQMFIIKIITGKSVYILMKEKMLKNLGKTVEHDFPGFIDIKESRIKEPFCNELNLLKSSLTDIHEICKVIETAGKAEFYQFIAASEMSEFEKTIEKNTDPDFILKSGLLTEKTQIRNEIFRQFHEIIETVDNQEKEKVYEIIRGFFILRQLVTYNFDNFQKKVEYEPNGNKYSSFGNCRKFIREIYELIYNIQLSPAPFAKVLKFMAEFYYEKGDISGKVSKDDFVSKMLKKLKNDFASIESFNKNTPLVNLIKYLYKDLHYEASEISGGEEWFNIYKNYLKEKIDKKYDLFLADKKRNEIIMKMRYYIDTIPDENTLNFQVDLRERIYKFEYANLFFYLKELKNTFFQKKIDRIVSRILLDGVFYKDANKKELYEAYNFINKLDKDFKEFIDSIDNDNEAVKSIRKYSFEETSKKLQKKKTERFVSEIKTGLVEKYTLYYNAFVTVGNVLYGIVNGSVGGTYDTLSNVADVCEEKTFMSLGSISTATSNLKEILKMFQDLSDLYGAEGDGL